MKDMDENGGHLEKEHNNYRKEWIHENGLRMLQEAQDLF
jgi:hypothetical protein